MRVSDNSSDLASRTTRSTVALFSPRLLVPRHCSDANCFSLGQIETNYDEVTDSFDSMALKQELLRGECLARGGSEIEATIH